MKACSAEHSLLPFNLFDFFCLLPPTEHVSTSVLNLFSLQQLSISLEGSSQISSPPGQGWKFRGSDAELEKWGWNWELLPFVPDRPPQHQQRWPEGFSSGPRDGFKGRNMGTSLTQASLQVSTHPIKMRYTPRISLAQERKTQIVAAHTTFSFSSFSSPSICISGLRFLLNKTGINLYIHSAGIRPNPFRHSI